jgi:hypothetical protein
MHKKEISKIVRFRGEEGSVDVLVTKVAEEFRRARTITGARIFMNTEKDCHEAIVVHGSDVVLDEMKNCKFSGVACLITNMIGHGALEKKSVKCDSGVKKIVFKRTKEATPK